MFPRISTQFKRIIAMLTQHRRPIQVAFGFAIGLIFGLIPKDNLVAVALLSILILLPVNQMMACITAASVFLLSGVLTVVTSYVGTLLLAQPLVTGMIEVLYRIPLVPWSCLDNPMVLGGLGIGWITFLPNYTICRWSLSQVSRKLEQRALEQVADEAIQYRKKVADQARQRQEKPAPPLKLVMESGRESTVERLAKEPVVNIVAAVAAESEKQSAERQASKRTERGTIKQASRKIQQRVLPTVFTGDSHWDGNETILRETVIEVVRYRSPNATDKQTANKSPMADAQTAIQGTSMPAGNASTVDIKDANSIAYDSSNLTSANKVTTANQSISFDSAHVPGVTSNRDESLRYLLWHINGSRENVRKSSEKTA